MDENELLLLAKARAAARLRMEQEQASAVEPQGYTGEIIKDGLNNPFLSGSGDFQDNYDQSLEGMQTVGKAVAPVALEAAGSYLLPQALALKAGPAVDFVGRGAQYGVNALTSATGGELGRKLSQLLGMSEPTSLGEDADRVMTDTAIGGAIPLVADAGMGAIKGIANYSNSPNKVARTFGATNNEMNPNINPKTMGQQVSYLEQNSPEFRQSVMSNTSIPDAYNQAANQLNTTGQEIQRLYASNKGLVADITDLANNPSYLKLVDVAENPAGGPAIQTKAINALREIEIPLTNVANRTGGKIPLLDLWMNRRSIDQLIKNFGDPSLVDSHLIDARTAVNDVIESTLTKMGNVPEAQALSKLNAEYSALSDLTDSLGRRVGQLSGKGLVGLSQDSLVNPRTVAPIAIGAAAGTALGMPVVGGIAGATIAGAEYPPAANYVRAKLYQGGQAIDALRPLLEKAPQALNTARSLLPRDTKVITNNTDHTNAVITLAQKARMILTPDQYTKLPKSLKNNLISQLAEVFPQAFETSPEGYGSLMDGSLGIIDKYEHIKKAMKDYKENHTMKAEVIGKLLEDGTYTPIDEQQLQPPSLAPMSQIDIGKLSSAFSDIPMSSGNDGSFAASDDTLRMMRAAQRSQSLTDYQNSGG